MGRIYLDHTATTPLDPRVLDAMRPYFNDLYGNASSVHWHGRQAKGALEKSRETLASLLGASAGEIVFTSGGTESNNFALRGVARPLALRGRNHIVTSRAEHHAVLEPCEALEKEGIEVTYLGVDQYGSVSSSQILAVCKPTTSLVSIMHANNEVGTISPVREIVDVLHPREILVHTDAVQSFGKIPVNVHELGVDLLTISGHKIYGPKGVGALYVRKGTEINPLLHGGGQERGKRPGTENVAFAVGLAEAARLACQEREEEAKRLEQLRGELEKRISEKISGVIFNGHPTERLPHILNISFDSSKHRIEGEMLVMNMDLHGISVTSGSACTSGSMQPSHVLLAMGRDSATAKATLRFSFGHANKTEDVQRVFEELQSVLREMTKKN
ncbi:MAG TPA: cysteine desulfurase family protein [Bacteroidota bacterium]